MPGLSGVGLRAARSRWNSFSSIGALCLVGLVLSSCGSTTGAVGPVSRVAERAQQVADDTVYLPVQVNGQWVLAGPPGTWLQGSISTTSSPWRWDYPCAVLDPSLVSGIRAFMTDAITQTFSGKEAALLQGRLDQKLGPSISSGCHSPNPNVAEGPPGPILDRLVIQNVSVVGSRATVTGQVHVTDWQGGVTHIAVPGGGRQVGWATVPGLLNSSFTLEMGSDGHWRVTAFSSTFAPGHEP